MGCPVRKRTAYLLAIDEARAVFVRFTRMRPEFGFNRAEQSRKLKPCAGAKFNCRQWFHKFSFVSDRDHRGHAWRTAPKKAAASPATGTSE
jgi:hypothetical protein